ncbi:MAG: hypothetical protein GX868_17220 [Actinobacteria bacterium]|nr:hypothetical protein [Actinomycetota bacterium]
MLLRPRTLLASTCLTAVVFGGGCSKDLPSKRDFIDAASSATPAGLVDQLADAEIAPGAARTLVEGYLGCLYDAISTDEDLIGRVVSDPDSTTTQGELSSKAPDCTDRARQAILDAMTASDQ